MAVREGRLSVSAGCVVASELRQLAPLLEPGAVDAVAAGLVAMGEVDGTAGVRRVRPAMLARYGLGQRLQDLEDRHRGLTVLSCGHDIGGGITEYRMRLNPEARAVVEAAINVLSAPTTRHSDDERRAVNATPVTRGPSTNAAATPSSRSAAARSASLHPLAPTPPAALTAPTGRSFTRRRGPVA